jgi:hypothetical protein
MIEIDKKGPSLRSHKTGEESDCYSKTNTKETYKRISWGLS